MISKNENAQICVIGAGGWGKNHINTLNRLGHLYGIVDKDKSALKLFNNLNENLKFHTSVEDAISHGYDGYVIATPAETHFELASILLQESQNILIEKPVCLNYKDSQTLLDQAQKNNCFSEEVHWTGIKTPNSLLVRLKSHFKNDRWLFR